MNILGIPKVGVVKLTGIVLYAVFSGTLFLLLIVQLLFGAVEGLDASGNVVAALIGVPVTASLACAAVIIGLRVEETQRDVASIECARLTHDLELEFASVIICFNKAMFHSVIARDLVEKILATKKLETELEAFWRELQEQEKNDLADEGYVEDILKDAEFEEEGPLPSEDDFLDEQESKRAPGATWIGRNHFSSSYGYQPKIFEDGGAALDRLVNSVRTDPRMRMAENASEEAFLNVQEICRKTLSCG
ncbi:MAG: hypothetical protein ACK5X0_10450, partial [Rhodospirillales bacterium]